MTRLRTVLAAVVAAGLTALALLLTAGPAAAHAELVSTDPADGAVLSEAPSGVTLTFSEPVRLTAEQEITVYDADGEPVATDAGASGSEVRVGFADPGALARGTYVVGWYVVSADGHPISGSFGFSVDERSARVAAAPAAPTASSTLVGVQGVVVGATYVGLLVAAGLAAFVVLVLPTAYAGQSLRRRIRTAARAAAGLAGLGALLQVPLASAYARGAGPTDLLDGLDVDLVGGELVAAALVLVGLGVVVAALRDEPPDGLRRAALLAGAATALVAPAVVGHTRSYSPRALVVVGDLVHVGAGAVWLGGLLGLVLSLRALDGRERALTLARFSTLAGGLLVAVAAAGSVLAWRILGSWSGFVETGYGRLLLVKIGLALVVAAIGGWNRFGLLPRVGSAEGHAGHRRAAVLVSRTVTAEALVIVCLLGVTGFLVDRSPRPEPASAAAATGSETRTARAGDLLVYVEMSPRVTGANTVQIHLHDADGRLVSPRRPPVVSLRTEGLDLGDVPVTGAADGSSDADVLLPRAGTWEVQVSVRLGRFDNPVTTVRFDVADAAG